MRGGPLAAVLRGTEKESQSMEQGNARPAPTFWLKNVSGYVSMSRVFGHLRIVPGEVSFEPSSTANKWIAFEQPSRVVHHDPDLTVVIGRLLPPWLNSGLVLVDENAPGPYDLGVIQMASWQRRAATRALASAGFRISVLRTMTSMGGGIGSRSELDSFRQSH